MVERPQKAAQANSVREVVGQLVGCGGAGLSLRDITYNKTHASRASEIAVIFRTSGENSSNEVAQLVQPSSSLRSLCLSMYKLNSHAGKARDEAVIHMIQLRDRCHKKNYAV